MSLSNVVCMLCYFDLTIVEEMYRKLSCKYLFKSVYIYIKTRITDILQIMIYNNQIKILGSYLIDRECYGVVVV